MAFENNLAPFEITFYPTTLGANTLLNGGISQFKYYSLCDRFAYYPANESTLVPSIMGSTIVLGKTQTTVPNELINNPINQVPVNAGVNVKEPLLVINK
jgi:hypothetical protein